MREHHQRMREPTDGRPRRAALAALATAGLAATAGCSASAFVRRKRRTETGTIDPGDAAALAVHNLLGGLTVKTADRTDVRYRADMRSSLEEKNFDELSVRSRRDGDRAVLEAVHKEDGTVPPREPKLDLTVWVPAALSVAELRAEAGDVVVRGTDGDLTARVRTGDLTISDVAGDVTARVDTGDVTVRGVAGFVGGRIGTGDVEIREVGGITDISMATGDLTVEVPALRADTTVEVRTGDVTAELGGIDAKVVATADTGDVEVQELTLATTERGSSARAEGTLGEVTHRLRVAVTNGDITLSALER